jgi:hypothetical protein
MPYDAADTKVVMIYVTLRRSVRSVTNRLCVFSYYTHVFCN